MFIRSPNITGTFGNLAYQKWSLVNNGSFASGAFAEFPNSDYGTAVGTDGEYSKESFDGIRFSANFSRALYKLDTVQPQSIRLLAICRT